MSITVSAPVWLWNADKGTWHFLTISADDAVEIRMMSAGNRRGFGSVKVLAQIGATSWQTSLFPSRETGGYILPIKADVRRREGIEAGDEVLVEVDVI
ncbi:MAG: hypothetical protein RLZZ58_914 [Pseudomonadota bacterium]